MLRGLGHEVSPRGVARLYAGLVDLFVLDGADAALGAGACAALGMRVLVTDTVMHTPARAGPTCRGRAARARRDAHDRRRHPGARPAHGPARATTSPRLLGDAIDAARVGLKAAATSSSSARRWCRRPRARSCDLDDVDAVGVRRAARRAHRRGQGPARRTRSCCARASRIVRMDRGHLIVETRHGWVCANAGVDESNGLGPGRAHAAAARRRRVGRGPARAPASTRFGVELAVVVTDTFGRPWREGLVEVALGCAGHGPAARPARPRRPARARSCTTPSSRSPTRWRRRPGW